MKVWCVAYTQASKEKIALHHLREQGFEVYLPQFKKTCRHARRVEEKLYPLFPRYIFVEIDLEQSRFRSINGTRGISHLMMSDSGRPFQITSSVIDSLKAQEIAAGYVPLASLMTFTKGEQLRIVDGAFQDHVAIFEKMEDRDRVELLLTFMGQETRITVPTYSVEAA